MLLMVSINSMAQTVTYTVSKDAKNGDVIFNGALTFTDLYKEPTFTWLKKGYDEYNPNAAVTSHLKEYLNNFTIVVFLGTWCDDSHELIPKLARVLDIAGFPKARLTMYGVDREKTTNGGEHKKYNITLVPTIILFNNEGKEVGRITETVNKSLEEDLDKIVSLAAKESHQ